MKIFEVKKLKESLEFTEKSEKIVKAKIAAHVFFTTDEAEIISLIRKADQEELLIQVLLEKLKVQDFYLEFIHPVTKRG